MRCNARTPARWPRYGCTSMRAAAAVLVLVLVLCVAAGSAMHSVAQAYATRAAVLARY